MKKLRILSVACGLLGLIAGGCATSDSGAYIPANVKGKDVESTAPIVLLDKTIYESVDCSAVQETKLADGRLQIKANLRNRTSARLHIQAGCVFKDAQGFQVEESDFHDLILSENAQETVSFQSSNDKAVRYTVRVRQAH